MYVGGLYSWFWAHSLGDKCCIMALVLDRGEEAPTAVPEKSL